MCIRDRYRLNCSDCTQFYIGQTGRSFKLRYKEHIPSSKSNVEKSTFAEHLSSHDHNIKSIGDNLDILHKCKKSLRLDTLERFEIYKAIKEDYNRVLNEKSVHANNTYLKMNFFL